MVPAIAVAGAALLPLVYLVVRTLGAGAETWDVLFRLRVLEIRGRTVLLVAGVAATFAQLFSMWAIKNGNLAVVIPLHNIGPVFSITMAAIFLRRRERVTKPVVTGVALVVAGATLVNL